MRQFSEATQAVLRQRVEQVPKEQRESFLVKMIAKDFYLYLERNLMIRDKVSGSLIPFELNWAQKLFVDRVLDDLAKGEPVRYIILKARQLGISTVIEALCYWWTATHRNVSSVILAHEKDTAKNLYEMFRRFYANSHPSFQPVLKYNTKSDITFDAEDEAKAAAMRNGEPIPGLGSQIATGVARKDIGHGLTNHFFHGSEVARWEDSADIASGMMQTVPLAPNTFVFLESTANGVGNYFFSEWMEAEKGEGSFKPFFLPWWRHGEYELPESGGTAPYSDYEAEVIRIMSDAGIPEADQLRKVAWTRRKRREFKNEPKKFFEQYPHDPMTAFLSSGNYAFSPEALMGMLDRAKEAEVWYAELAMDEKRKVTATYVDESPLKVWFHPQENRKYVIGGDVAEGIVVSSSTGKEGDYSVATVMDVATKTVVARWRGHIDPDQFGEVLFTLGMWYNSALVAPEINNHGIVTLQKLINMFYRNLFRRENSAEHQFQEPTALMGWKTDKATKPRIIKELAADIREKKILDLDPVSIGEAMSYMQDDKGRYDGKANGHDDCVISLAIANMLADWMASDVDYAKEHIVKKNSKRVQRHGTTTIDADDRSDSVRAARKSSRSRAKAAVR